MNFRTGRKLEEINNHIILLYQIGSKTDYVGIHSLSCFGKIWGT